MLSVDSQLPRAVANWALNRSTIIMPCNSTGLLDPATTAGWAVVDFDVRLCCGSPQLSSHAFGGCLL